MRRIPPFLICIAIGVFLWQSFDIRSYREYHSTAIAQNVTASREQMFLTNVEIEQSPQREDWLIRRIDSAQKELKVAVYMFTVPSLMEAILRAKKRGVDVQIILEKNPYNATSINDKTVQFLQKNGIDFYETNDGFFSFMHAKYMIIDDTWIIATANWTRSSFSSNREFFVIGTDKAILEDLRNVFETDFTGKQGISYDSRIMVGPTDAREKLIRLIERSQTTIKLYMPSLTDEGLILAFQEACSRGSDISILLDANAESVQKKNITKGDCPKIRMMKKTPLHAKVLIIDDKEGFIGSFNFTKNSLENNREIGVFLDGKTIYKIVNIFEGDWRKSVAFW